MQKLAKNVDEDIGMFSKEIQLILETIRTTLQKAAPQAAEVISYRMPADKLSTNAKLTMDNGQ